ncbi:MAG: aminotransferase class IV [Candidatus Magasanikbacteria bacterium]|nr:aminotransferase class IV [Candidatus Magasanikbacteria bacterium]
MDFPWIVINGEVRPREEAVVSLFDLEFSYGFGVYENIRVDRGWPYFLTEHSQRLLRSAALIGLAHHFNQEWLETSEAALRAKYPSAATYNLKILLLGGQDADNARLYLLPLAPYFPERRWYREGVNLTSIRYERYLPAAKTLNMLGSYLAYGAARQAGSYDALLIDKEGRAREGTRTNFFVVSGQTIITAPAEAVLAGVTRDKVIEAARELGYQVKDQLVPLAEVFNSDGAFITGTSAKILPVRQIDKQLLPAVPLALRQLMKQFDEYLNSVKTSG